MDLGTKVEDMRVLVEEDWVLVTGNFPPFIQHRLRTTRIMGCRVWTNGDRTTGPGAGATSR